jgi:hypothetical protein
LTTFLIDLSPGDMAHRLGEALTVYVDAMSYPRGTEGQRASMWLEHTRRNGWRGVAAVEVDADLGRAHHGRLPLSRVPIRTATRASSRRFACATTAALLDASIASHGGQRPLTRAAPHAPLT